MGIPVGITEEGGYAIFEPLGNKVLQAFRFFVYFIPRVLQNIVKKQFQKPMMADELPGAALTSSGQASATMPFVENQRRPLQRKLLEHSGDRRRADTQTLG